MGCTENCWMQILRRKSIRIAMRIKNVYAQTLAVPHTEIDNHSAITSSTIDKLISVVSIKLNTLAL